MKTYVINLDRSPGRMAFMAEQLQARKIDFERISAVDGRKLDASAWPGEHLGVIGCSLSHRIVWQRLLSSGDSHAAVLEDDAWLSPDLGLILKEESWIPRDAEVIKIETTGTKVRLSRKAVTVPCSRRLLRLHTIHEGSAGYIVSRAGAQRLLDRSEVLKEPADIFMFSDEALASYPVYQMVPAPVRQRSIREDEANGEFGSTIDVDRFAASKPMLRIFDRRKFHREVTRPFRDLAAWARSAAGVDAFRVERVPFR